MTSASTAIQSDKAGGPNRHGLQMSVAVAVPISLRSGMQVFFRFFKMSGVMAMSPLNARRLA